jgi:hypothetical protein
MNDIEKTKEYQMFILPIDIKNSVDVIIKENTPFS